MSLSGFLPPRERSCAAMLSATVLCAMVCAANCGTVVLQQTPAQERGGGGGGGGHGGGGFLDHLYSLNPFASAPAQPSYNIPDVAGFGMYPLWKFHKFDGLSLRPVPYGVDIGSGLPPPPHPPSYPAGFLNAPNPPTRQQNYGPPAAPPPTNYEAAPPSNAPSYSPPAAPAYNPPPYNPPQDYGTQQQPQILNYELASTNYQQPQGNNYGNSYNPPAASSYQPNTGAQLSFSYQPVQGQRYNEPTGAYSAPTSTYAEPQAGYNSVPSSPSYGTPMGPASPGYDNMQYGASNGITIQFSAAPQDYGMQQPQSTYNPSPSSSFQIPSYASPDSSGSMTMPYSQLDTKPSPMDSGYGSSGFMKRSETTKGSVSSDAPSTSENSFST